MAISVISSANASPKAGQILNGASSTDSSANGFADLLFSQLSPVIAGLPGQLGTGDTAKEKAGTDKKDLAAEQTALTADPALAFLMGTPVAQAPIITNNGAAQLPTDLTAKDGQSISDPNTQENTLFSRSDMALTNAALKSSTGAAGQATKDTTGNALLAAKQVAAGEPPPAEAEKTGNITVQNILATKEGASITTKGGDSLSLPANIAAEPRLPSGQDSSAQLGAIANSTAKAEAVADSKAQISTPLHSAAWGSEFANKVVWLAKNDQQQAQININPAQLGPIQITLHLNGDQATATFGSANAEVRQAIENSLPQLKEMLSSAGINLGQADVGANLAQQNREVPYQAPNGNRLANETAILPGDGNIGNGKGNPSIQQGRGLVDLFA